MWDKVFNAKNPFWQTMGTVFDLFVVNSLWLLCCLPVFTIGPATTAVFYCVIERLLGNKGYISHLFFTSFKRNFRQGIVLGVPLTFLGAFLAADIYLCRHAGTGIFTFFMFFFIAVFVFWCFTVFYTFPLLAKFERRSRDILIWAFTLSIKNILMTLTMMFVAVAGIWLCHILPGLIFIMFGLCAQFCGTIILSIIKPYLPVYEEIDYSDENGVYDFNPHPDTEDEEFPEGFEDEEGFPKYFRDEEGFSKGFEDEERKDI